MTAPSLSREKDSSAVAASATARTAPVLAQGKPEVPTRYILCSDDRLMNDSFWRAAVRERVA